MNYNAVISVEDISDDSGVITEPVSLEEMKNYLRTEGFEDASSINPEPSISITLPQGQTSVQDNRLIDAVILSLARETAVYTQGLTVANAKFVFDSGTGTLTFLDAGNTGGETLAISYGYSNGSGVFNFTTDDDLLSEMITAARELIEEKGGISIVSHTWEAVITNLCGMIEIPYGPIVSITSIVDSQGTTLTTDQYKTVGNQFKFLKWPCDRDMIVTYAAGYDVVPKPIKIDIMRLVAYLYENRGEGKAESFAFKLSSKYSRNTVIV